MTQKNLSCSHFIEGKIKGSPIDYEIIARTSNLSDLVRLKSISSSHRLLEKDAKKGDKAIGVFIDERCEYFVLMQVELAVEDNGNLALDRERAEFKQSHYIFLPIDLVTKEQCSMFRLLNWLGNEPIPYVLKSEDYNLSSLDIPLAQLSEELDRQDEDKVLASLSATDNQGQPLILSALSALFDGKQILFTPDKDNYANFLKSILLLLPAAFRSELAIAMGIIDEERCSKWAKLIIKLNGSPKSKLPENLIWLNRSANQINGHDNKLIRIIKKILENAPDKLFDLLRKLNEITDNVGKLEEPAYLEIVTRLIGILPDELQDEEWNKCLTQVSVNQWNAIIPYLKDEQKGLLVAWQKLGNSIIQNQQDNYNIIVNIFKHLSPHNQLWILQENLINNLSLTEVLVNHNFLQETFLQENAELEKLSKLLFKELVKHKSLKDGWQEAWRFLSSFILKDGKAYFKNEHEKYLTLDAVLAGEITAKDKETFSRFFNTDCVPLIPHLQTIENTNLSKTLKALIPEVDDLLNNLFKERAIALKNLVSLVKLTKMEAEQEDSLYIGFLQNWSLSFKEARPLLVEILKERLSPDKEFKDKSIAQTCEWFKNQEPKLIQIFSNFKTNTKDWTPWNELAQVLYDNPEDQAQYLDDKVGKLFWVEVLQIRLPIIANNSIARGKFLKESAAWQALLNENLSEGKLNSRLGEYALTLTLCLGENDKTNSLNGDLLHYLRESLAKQKQVDEKLGLLITSPSVTKNFNHNDWLKLQYLCWTPGIKLELPPGRPDLTPTEKAELVCQAKKTIKEEEFCTQPEQTWSLLKDCEAWGLNLTERKEILKHANPQGVDVKLLLDILNCDSQQIKLEQNRDLLRLLIQVSPRNELESSERITFFAKMFTNLILSDALDNLAEWLEWLKKESDKQIDIDAIAQSVQNLASLLSSSKSNFYEYLPQLKNCSEKLEQLEFFKESQLINKLVHNKVSKDFPLR